EDGIRDFHVTGVQTCALPIFKSFKSNKGSWWSSQYLKINDITPDCVSFKSKIRDKSTGPNSDMVARNRTPFCLLMVSNSTGNALGSKGKFIFVWRSSIKGVFSPASAIPLKSPFISIIKTGMPLLDNCSDNT